MEDMSFYIDELKRMQTRAVAAKPQIAENMGGIQVSVTTLKGTYPIKNATVTVFSGEGKNAETVASEQTDSSGNTPVMPLTAPDKNLSLQSETVLKPYAVYNVSVKADGYREKVLKNLSVFSGVESLLKVDLVSNATSNSTEPDVTDEASEFSL